MHMLTTTNSKRSHQKATPSNGTLLLKWLAAVCVLDGVGATGSSAAPPACDTGLFEQPGAPNHCACGGDGVFNIDKARMHLGDCCAPDVVASVSGKANCSDSSKCCISAATEIPVYTLGLAARQHAEKSFATSLENYVPPGSRYKLGR